MKKGIRWISGAMAVAVVLGAGQTAAYAEEDEPIRVQYKVGEGLKIGNGDNLVHIQGRVQGRFTYNALETAADNNTWAIQRGKFKIEGFTLQKKLRFGFQLNAATRSNDTTAAVCGTPADANGDGQIDTCAATNAVTAVNNKGVPLLEDYWIDYVPYSFVGIRVGQFKVPFLMQRLTSSGKQQFVDRSLATTVFDLAYDLGAAIHGDAWEHGLNYDVFFMNGDGANTINRNQSMIIGARLEYPILGTYERSEADINDSQDPNLGVGMAVAYNELGSATQAASIAAGTKTLNGTLDVGFKYKGWSFHGYGNLTRALDTAKLTNWGYTGQAGYFIVPKKFEVAAKSSGVVFSNARANQYEHSLGLNYYIVGHGIKLQTDYALLQNVRGLSLNDHRFRTQVQVVF